MTNEGLPGRKREKRSRFFLLQVVLWLVLMVIWFWLAITHEGELRFWYFALVVLSFVPGVISFVLFRKNPTR
jgi:hypothetical protein